MNFTQKKMLMNTSFKAQLNYCPLVWMLHSSKLNNRINKLHERCLRIRYNNNPRTFRTLELDKFVSVHHRNLKCLAIKLFKTLIGISPDIMTDVFLLNTFSV